MMRMAFDTRDAKRKRSQNLSLCNPKYSKRVFVIWSLGNATLAHIHDKMYTKIKTISKIPTVRAGNFPLMYFAAILELYYPHEVNTQHYRFSLESTGFLTASTFVMSQINCFR